MTRTCEVCMHLPPADRTRDRSRRPRPLIFQDRIVCLCDPHAERVVGSGASSVEALFALCAASGVSTLVAASRAVAAEHGPG